MFCRIAAGRIDRAFPRGDDQSKLMETEMLCGSNLHSDDEMRRIRLWSD